MIQSYTHDVQRDTESMFKDGFWVVVCDQVRQAKSVGDLAYFAQMYYAQQVYVQLAEDEGLRDRLLGKCHFKTEKKKNA